MDFRDLYKLADKFVAEQEATLRRIERTLPSPQAEFALREHLRGIESTLDRIERDGPSIPLDILDRVRT
jgi:hypothetical protein